MKIAIVELNFHFDSLDSLCKLFTTGNNELFVFTKKELYQRLSEIKESPKITFHLQTGTRIGFIKKNLEIINSCDFIFVNTISRDFRLFSSIKFNPVTIARIHNINKTFDPWHHMLFTVSPVRMWKTFSYFIRDGILGLFFVSRKGAINNIDYFTFPDENMLLHVEKKHYLPKEKLWPVLPIKFYTGFIPAAISGSTLKITIIGAVDFRRKDYFTAIAGIANAANLLKKHVQLTFLGKAIGKDKFLLDEMISNTRCEWLTVRTFDNFVNQEDFKTELENTNLLVSPTKDFALIEIYREQYGVTKMSGAISDMVAYAIPIILYKTNVNDDLVNFLDVYQNQQELTTIIQRYLQHPEELNRRKENLVKFLSISYSIENNYQQFMNHLSMLKFSK